MAKNGVAYRVCVEVDEIWMELFKLTYSPRDGSLYLIQRMSENQEFGHFNGPANQNRFSIHPSIGEPFITLNNHIWYSDGTKITTKTRLHPSGLGTVYPLYIRNCCNHRAAHYITRLNDKDKYRVIASYDPEIWTLIYGVLVHDRTIDMAYNIKDATPYDALLIVDTNDSINLQITLFWGFVKFPAQRTANSVVPHSGHVVINTKLSENANLDRDVHTPSSPEDFIILLASMVVQMQHEWKERVIRQLEKGDQMTQELRRSLENEFCNVHTVAR